jgi:carbon storage regulator
VLHLTRSIGEAGMIGEDVSVTVIGIKGSQIQPGIRVPKHIEVHREEVFHRVMLEKQGKTQANS